LSAAGAPFPLAKFAPSLVTVTSLVVPSLVTTVAGALYTPSEP